MTTKKAKPHELPETREGEEAAERMTDLTRRILAVPKREMPTRKK